MPVALLLLFCFRRKKDVVVGKVVQLEKDLWLDLVEKSSSVGGGRATDEAEARKLGTRVEAA